MAQTYLSLVNKVLVNLRESQVSTVAQSSYSSLIGSYVNIAKAKVEDTWDWRCLAASVTMTTVIGQQSYALTTGSSPTPTVSPSPLTITDRSYLARDSFDVAQVICTTGSSVVMRPKEWVYEDLLWNIRAAVTLVNQPPYAFAYSPIAGVPTILLARPTDGAYTLEVRMFAPQAELSVETDSMLVPYMPVVSYATYLAMQERGEELGTNADMYLQMHNDQLAREISADKQPGDFTLQNN